VWEVNGQDEYMERVKAELFTDGSNNAVVRLPGRLSFNLGVR
jgi:hypothetical protein